MTLVVIALTDDAWSTDGVISDRDGDKPLTLHGGVGFYTPDYDACFEDPECVEFSANALDGNDQLALDGTDDYAATSGPIVDTADSFSVGLRVRFADTTPDRPMTVLSQGDADSDAFKVRYDPAASEWQLVVTRGSEPGAVETVVAGPGAPTSYSDEVVVVYDDSEGHRASLLPRRVPGGPGDEEARAGWRTRAAGHGSRSGAGTASCPGCSTPSCRTRGARSCSAGSGCRG